MPTSTRTKVQKSPSSGAQSKALVIVLGLAGIAATLMAGTFGWFPHEARSLLHLEPRTDVVAQPQTSPTPEVRTSQPPDVKRKPKLFAVFADSVEDLRRRDIVTRIQDSESDKTLAELPPGSFGFTGDYEFVYRDLDRVQLRPSGNDQDFEVHKIGSGQIYTVAHVGPETQDRLRAGLESGEKLTLYSDKWKDAPNLAAIPADRLKCQRGRTIRTRIEKMPALVVAMDCEAN